MNAVTETVVAEPVSGVEIYLPLAKLKKSPRNARKVPHGEAAIEALAASIQHKGLIQNLVVGPETKEDGAPPTGNTNSLSRLRSPPPYRRHRCRFCVRQTMGSDGYGDARVS